MNILRQYTQPNCTLILEGMEDVSEENVDILDGQCPMSILINAECKFIKSQRQLSGGSVFLENLAVAVSRYAQGFLSGLTHPKEEATEYPQIQIEKVAENHLHRLTFAPEPNSGEEKQEINLTTVELFDLVDTIDQMYSDRSTLPNLTLELNAIGKRYRKPEQPLAERAKPAVVGVASLAIAAAIFYLIPAPEIREPKPELEAAPTETTIPVTPEAAPPGDNTEPVPASKDNSETTE